jgi:selenocysteine lyase/cysteine desulfurase
MQEELLHWGRPFCLYKKIGPDLIGKEEQALTRRALHGLSKIPGLRIFGIKDPESPRFSERGGIIVFELKGKMANKLAAELAERGGIGVRYGCHCAHILIKHLLELPPSLQKFQRIIVVLFPKLRLPGIVRVSFGIGNNEEDVDTLIQVMDKISGKKGTSGKAKSIMPQIDKFIKAASHRVYSGYN